MPGFPGEAGLTSCHRVLSPHQAIHLLQIAREAPSNVFKHAEATAVTVTVSCQDNQVEAFQGSGITAAACRNRTNEPLWFT